jgi:hypothetical protein
VPALQIIEPARVKGGRLIAFDRDAVQRQLPQFEGKRVEVVIRAKRDKRSVKQNRLYWGYVIRPLAAKIGYTDRECHEAMKWRLLGLVNPDAKFPVIRSTTSCSVDEFTTFVEDILQIAAGEGLVITFPGEAPRLWYPSEAVA